MKKKIGYFSLFCAFMCLFSSCKPSDYTCGTTADKNKLTLLFDSPSTVGTVNFETAYVLCADFIGGKIELQIKDGSTLIGSPIVKLSSNENNFPNGLATTSHAFSTSGRYVIKAIARKSGSNAGDFISGERVIEISSTPPISGNSFHIIQLEMPNDELWSNTTVLQLI